VRVLRVTMLDGGRRALVVLSPSWIARLFGKRPTTVELVKDLSVECAWSSAVTGRALLDMAYGHMICAALEAQPTIAPEQPVRPQATAILGKRGAP